MAAYRRLHLLEGAAAEERRAIRRNRFLRDRQNAFHLPEEDFILIFRLNQEAAMYVCDTLRPHIKATRKSSLPVELKVLSALNFLATGSYQRPVGLNLYLAVSQKTVSRCVTEITNAVNKFMLKNWVIFPMSQAEQTAIKAKFMTEKDFPGVIGAIDCTHVKIKAPNLTDRNHPEHLYVNRHGYHSINVQLICDYGLRILNVNAKYPGATHDSFIWKSSNVYDALKQMYTAGNLNAWLLGESGYPLQPWLMTPILNAAPDSPEQRFSDAHAKARNCIERCNGVLKSRFRCLLSERGWHYSPQRASMIINTCVVLHNICKHFNLPESDVMANEQNNSEDAIDNIGQGVMGIIGSTKVLILGIKLYEQGFPKFME